MKQYIDDYTDFLKVEKRQSLNTVLAYQCDINHFCSYFSKKKLEAITGSDVRCFLIYLRKKGFAQSTVARFLSSLKSFYKYLLAENLIMENPTENIESPRSWRKLPNVLSLFEVDALLATPDLKSIVGIRDLAMLELLYPTFANSQL